MRKFLALIVAVFLLGMIGRPACAEDVVPVGVLRVVSDTPLFLAEKKGYFHEEGITVKFIPFISGAKMVAPLGTGEIAAGAGATSAGLYNAEQRGIDIKVVADKATNRRGFDYRALLVRKALVTSGKFKTLADLRGLKIGIVAEGAADNSILNAAVVKAGLTINDVDRVYLGFSPQILALDHGAIDAAINIEPDITRALRLGSVVRFMPVSDFYPVQQTAVLFYSGDFIAKHHDEAMRFMVAYLRAVRYYDDALKNGKITGPHADELIQLISEMTGEKDQSILRDMVANWCNPDGQVNIPSMKKDLAFFQAQGEVKGKISVDQVLDSSFAAAAVKKLGPYHPKS